MNPQTKSIIRHLLTAIGAVLVFLGLGKFTGVVEYLIANLDAVWDAALVIVGFATTLLGFFKDKERLQA